MSALMPCLRPVAAGPTRVATIFCLAGLLLLGGLTGCQKPAATHPDETAIRAFLERYFSTWSTQDMQGYGACFHPQARVYQLGEEGQVLNQGVTDFLHGQRMAHETSPSPMTEHAESMQILGDAKGAQAYVRWVLVKGGKEERGADLFTLQKDASGWKIISLAFYGDPGH